MAAQPRWLVQQQGDAAKEPDSAVRSSQKQQRQQRQQLQSKNPKRAKSVDDEAEPLPVVDSDSDGF